MNPSPFFPRGFRSNVSSLAILALAAALGCARAAESGVARTPLDELEPLSAQQSWGGLRVGRSVWDKPLRIGERAFEHGLGTHARSELTYELEGAYTRFEAWVGVDAAMAAHPEASVVFAVLADGREVFNSGVMRVDSPARRVSVDVTGARELLLRVTDAGDGINADHADWAEATLIGQRVTPPSAAAPMEFAPSAFEVSSPALKLHLSTEGQIVGASFPGPFRRRALEGGTVLAGCTNASPFEVRAPAGGGLEFVRRVRHERSGQTALLVDRFLGTSNSVRWEIEIEPEGGPWSTAIETRLRWPTPAVRWWTAWTDPVPRATGWVDPLAWQPLRNRRLGYGAPHWDERSPNGGYVGSAECFTIPMLTLAEPEADLGLTWAQSPEDLLLEATLQVRADGRFTWARHDHRLARGKTVRFAMDLTGHPADWRAGLGWMTRRYAPYFDPPEPRAHEIAGLGAYSDWEGSLDAERLRAMGFRVNWKASYDFPYMGMFLPPIPDNEPYPRLVKGNTTSIGQLRAYSKRMREMGFEVLNYFNVTEFGGHTKAGTNVDLGLAPTDRWKNVNAFMTQDIPDGVLRSLAGRPFDSWEGCVAMDCGGPRYRAFLLEQGRRHLERLPDSAGLCIDRLDWLRYYNFEADDGVSWRAQRPCRSLYVSWRDLLSALGPMFHEAHKTLFVNAMINRTDLFRQVDGIYHEFGQVPGDLNGAALQCVRKPCLAWTPDDSVLRPDPDAYFQRHLYLGVYPTAPLPENDHTIRSSPWTDQWYLDYGPLFQRLRGRQWVLRPHAIAVSGGPAKANLFEVPKGYLAAIVLGGGQTRATLDLWQLPRLGPKRAGWVCQAWYPGSATPTALTLRARDGLWTVDVPLRRGCALVSIDTPR